MNNQQVVVARPDFNQMLVIAVSIVVIVVRKDWVAYTGALTNLMLAIGWQFFSYKGHRSHHIAERGRRAVLLIGGLGLSITGKLYTDLLLQFTVTEAEGKGYEDVEYFKAYGPPGHRRLSMMLEESSFWSHHLYRKSATRYWLMFGIGLFIAFAGLLLLPRFADTSFKLIVAQAFCVLLTWLVTGNIFNNALGYTLAAMAVDDVEHRISGLQPENLDNGLLIILGDYNATVEDAPIIPTSIYKENQQTLNRLWAERQNHGH